MSAAVRTKDYARQYEPIWPEIEAALRNVFFEDAPVLGERVADFEAALARYHQVPHAVGVGSGTAAIVLALRALGIGPGDEVVTCAHNFTGVVSAIVLAGARPVLVDADPECGLLTAKAAASAIGTRTRALLAVHLYGHPTDLEALGELTRSAGIHLFEDGAQAHGARWGGRPIGGFGVACALSFHPSKNLGAFGDGGAVLTRDGQLAERLRVLRNLGKSAKYDFSAVSDNSKLDTIQAAILGVKLRHLDAWVERRRALGKRYLAGLSDVRDLVLPAERPGAQHAYHLFVVRTPARDRLKRYLAEREIGAGLHYPVAVHRQPAHAERFRGQSFPTAERWADEVLSLPLSPEHRDEEIDRVIHEVRSFFGVGPWRKP